MFEHVMAKTQCVLDGILCAVDDVVVFAYEKYEAEGCLATYRLAAVEIT
jgi:hypothetical protein